MRINKNMKIIKLAILSASCFLGLASLNALADITDETSGVYITGNLGYGGVDVSDATKDSGLTWNAAAGYQLDRYFAMEGGYIQFAHIEGFDPEVGGKFTVHPSAIYLAAKGILPLQDNFDLFAKVGAARTSISTDFLDGDVVVHSDSHRIVALFGVGGDYNINQHIAITAQFLTSTVSDDAFPATFGGTLGLTVKI
jgi:OmpA-OmpF porin, OOP family